VERHAQLDSACRACRWLALERLPGRHLHLRRQFFVIGLLALAFVSFVPSAKAQCDAGAASVVGVRAPYDQHNWEQVIAAALQLSTRSPDVNFEYGMALAHLQRWDEARAVLMAGRRACPKQKRFPIELAGVAFQRKKYPEAVRWIEKALRLDPHDEYANDFAGTVFLLIGNLDATLKDWNRIQKPQIVALKIDPQLRVQRLLLERAFVFSPQAELRQEALEASDARLDGLGIFPAYNIRLDARQDGKFDAEFHAIERNGFGNEWLQSLVSIFSGLPYATIYPGYFNIGGSAANFDSLVRWDAQKRRVWISFSEPLHNLPQWRLQVAADGRDENWAIRNSFTGTAQVRGSFKLKRELASGTITSIRSGRFGWTSGAELSHRTYSNVVQGSALTAYLVAPGYELKHLASLHATVLDVPEHRFTLSATAASEFARLWSSPPRLFEKVQGDATVRWLPQAEGDTYEFMQRVRGGGIVGTAPVDELWMIGVERDNDLWLRGHIGTRDGRKGSSPIADRYSLSNTDFYRSIWSNGLISIEAGPWLDVARASAPTSGLATRQWLVDAGAELKLSVLGTGVVLTYGRDLRTGNSAFYGSTMKK
jgi:tetratricopeptide (TPR) repeat protein